MSKPTAYRVARADTISKLEVAVDRMLSMGYLPHGSMLINSFDGTRFWQPMIYYDPLKK